MLTADELRAIATICAQAAGCIDVIAPKCGDEPMDLINEDTRPFSIQELLRLSSIRLEQHIAATELYAAALFSGEEVGEC
tara:strand:- start:236 stop:475 length:240 start_codon:yes stop_codon:yes gene_type:complete